MKTQKFQYLCVFLLIALLSSASFSFAGVFDNDEENWRRIFRDIKKINSRLVTMETGKMQALENVQKDLFSQIDEIKSLIPNLQGSVEQSQAEITGQFVAVQGKLADLESQIKQDIIASVDQRLAKIEGQVSGQLNQQKVANEKFQANLANQFDQLKSHMAGDMENFHKVNKEFFKEFDLANKQSLDQVVQRLNEQQQTLNKTQEIFKSDLIPAIVQQNEKNIQELRTVMSGATKENTDVLNAGLGQIQSENKKLTEIFQKSLQEGETIRTNIERLSQSITLTDQNVVKSHGDIVKLKDVLAQQMEIMARAQQDLVIQVKNGSMQTDQKVEVVHENMRVTDQKINSLAESLQGLQTQSQSASSGVAALQQTIAQNNALGEEKLNKLISSSTELAATSNNINQSLQGIEGGLANVELANQKLSKLIDILKTMATEQGKLSQVIAGQGEIKQSQTQLIKTQGELFQAQKEQLQSKGQAGKSQAQILKAQDELRQAQAKVLKTQAQILKAQEEIRITQKQSIQDYKTMNKTLADLSRKANVNISRNDAIRKTLANIGKKP